MNRFRDLGITHEVRGFVGDKIKMDRILNREIIVHDYKIENSKHNNGKCLHLQISIGQTKHVVFTGSVSLMEILEKVPQDKFPFITQIIKENERLLFS